jgi:hypothetical protein
MTTTDKLLPCPFCQGPAERYRTGHGTLKVYCGDPECVGSTLSANEDEWNRRASQAAPAPSDGVAHVVEVTAHEWEKMGHGGPSKETNYEVLLNGHRLRGFSTHGNMAEGYWGSAAKTMAEKYADTVRAALAHATAQDTAQTGGGSPE